MRPKLEPGCFRAGELGTLGGKCYSLIYVLSERPCLTISINPCTNLNKLFTPFERPEMLSLPIAHLVRKMSSINVAVVGVGLVGSEFISQLLQFPSPSPFKLVSVSSSKSTLFSPSGLSFSSGGWKADLNQSSHAVDLPALIKQLSGLVTPGQRVVLVENTSSEHVAALYPSFLSAGIDVITPNKKAYSGDLALYKKIVESSAATGARFLNEATVGAGLPIISTLKDLVATGDKVLTNVALFSK